jgi:hypothetical protein
MGTEYSTNGNIRREFKTVGKPEGETRFGRSRQLWENTTEMYFEQYDVKG